MESLFEVFNPKEYTHAGRVTLAATPYLELQRPVCICPLQIKQVISFN